MKKITFLLMAIFTTSWLSFSQTLNEPSNWPNANWELTGTFNSAALIADPTVDANWSYDDDAAGSGSTDILAIQSPVIDLTAAHAAGETSLTVVYDYNYNLGDVFFLDYYDADADAFVTWNDVDDNGNTQADWCGAIALSGTSAPLDISGFTANQLANFRYSFYYDASSIFGWGFCMSSSTITSGIPAVAPDNIDCANAASIACGETINASSVGSTGTSEDIGCAMGVNGIWYTFTGTGGDMTVSVDAGFDHRIGLASGSCGALVNIDCEDGSFATEIITFASVLDEIYYVYVAHFDTGNPSTGSIDITLTCAVIPDCTQAVIDSSTIVESCNPDGTGTYTIEHVVSNAGDAGTILDDGTATYPVVAGTVVTGPYNSGDSVTIELTGTDPVCDFTVGTFDFTCPPPAPDNIDCANAAPIACGETINATSEGSTGTAEDIGCAMGVNGIWYTFVGTGGDITISVSASFDHRIGLASGDCGALANIVCDDQSTGTESHTFASVLDETYYAYIAHYDSGNTTTGTIDITLTCAVVPTCTEAVIDSSTIVEACDPDGTGTYTLEHVVSNAGDEDTVLDDGTTTYPVVDGTVTTGPYNSGDSVTVEVVALDADCSYTLGTFDFTCPQPAPANDDAADAINLPVGDTLCETQVPGTNIGATTSVENDTEASCSSFDPAGDVWFKVMVPSSGELTIEISAAAVNSILDTVMEVYSGTSGALVEIACDDDIGFPNLFSRVELTGLTPGEVLLVRVWEFGDNLKGDFNICAWSPSSLGIEDNTFDGFAYYPNPVKDVLTLDSPRAIDNIEVFNVLGQRIIAIDSQNTIQNIDMSNAQSGVYLVKISIGNQTKTIRVLKE